MYRGNYGHVYLVNSIETKRQYVLKVICSGVWVDPPMHSTSAVASTMIAASRCNPDLCPLQRINFEHMPEKDREHTMMEVNVSLWCFCGVWRMRRGHNLSFRIPTGGHAAIHESPKYCQVQRPLDGRPEFVHHHGVWWSSVDHHTHS